MKPLLFLAAALLMPAAVAAEPTPGPPLKLPPTAPSEIEFRRRLLLYADCLVARRVPELTVFLDESIGGRGAAASAKRLARAAPACARPRGGSKGEQLLLRGAIFEALYRKDFAAAPAPTPFAGVAPTGYGRPGGGDPDFRVMLRGIFALFDCAVRKEPGRVAEMLRHPTGSESEAAAFAALDPALAGCQPGGRRILFPAPFARPYMSEILYILSLRRARP